MDAREHYDEAYFEWQRQSGHFGGWAELPKFERFVKDSDVVIDFGCGGGFLLKALSCRRRIGVEINPAARKLAATNGVEIFQSTAELPDLVADVVITDNALEHTTNPLLELRALHAKLKPGGKLVVVVPCETVHWQYSPGDINYHLFSWGPMCLGNLVTEAGYTVLESKPYLRKWPPRASSYGRLLGRHGFEFASFLYALVRREWFQVRAVACKPLGSP